MQLLWVGACTTTCPTLTISCHSGPHPTPQLHPCAPMLPLLNPIAWWPLRSCLQGAHEGSSHDLFNRDQSVVVRLPTQGGDGSTWEAAHIIGPAGKSEFYWLHLTSTGSLHPEPVGSSKIKVGGHGLHHTGDSNLPYQTNLLPSSSLLLPGTHNFGYKFPYGRFQGQTNPQQQQGGSSAHAITYSHVP